VADELNPAAAKIARETNAHILALDERFGEVSAHARDGDLIDLVCECGCLARVTTTRSQYEAVGGVWIKSHAPPE
jgi:hypothetical protein